MVGKVGLEPTVYLTSRIYSPLQSPLCILAHISPVTQIRSQETGRPHDTGKPAGTQNWRSALPTDGHGARTRI